MGNSRRPANSLKLPCGRCKNNCNRLGLVPVPIAQHFFGLTSSYSTNPACGHNSLVFSAPLLISQHDVVYVMSIGGGKSR